ncbi:hypothetical protein N7326_04085 [Corynebacterium sp. ES2794-CONJ1]|uniref:hypothetical protein n=1 Tax=unclassified Corynebacterium TaxID=2624378 RepID=UPI0021674F94|nr:MULTISPECIES: hypothetical protein [unclassified Corynebacterium]MCS4489745.1 hypothetical protein [Corynebacterium sp. ES2775-CONJ]MCS4491246.1 hypothetical protein [Corynebacterium sp. ES2715-CONJ3]MCS4531657.1 hypothetical protein [Corynebacterium sp. ES2730-CONJ]MCU9519053.1 hypothetical protein [Corynebacterium sp. ES2794-CONJ1]
MSAANNTTEYPVFNGEESSRMHYIEGYEPVSYAAPHSALLRTSTWVGMGFVLASVAGFGTLIFGFATKIYGTQDNASFFMLIGAILAVSMMVIGFGLIYHGRRFNRQYRQETGRVA